MLSTRPTQASHSHRQQREEAPTFRARAGPRRGGRGQGAVPRSVAARQGRRVRQPRRQGLPRRLRRPHRRAARQPAPDFRRIPATAVPGDHLPAAQRAAQGGDVGGGREGARRRHVHGIEAARRSRVSRIAECLIACLLVLLCEVVILGEGSGVANVKTIGCAKLTVAATSGILSFSGTGEKY